MTTHVYVGLAGETAPNRPVKSGLYRMAVGQAPFARRQAFVDFLQ